TSEWPWWNIRRVCRSCQRAHTASRRTHVSLDAIQGASNAILLWITLLVANSWYISRETKHFAFKPPADSFPSLVNLPPSWHIATQPFIDALRHSLHGTAKPVHKLSE